MVSPKNLQDLEFRQLVERVKLRSPIESFVGDRVGDLRQRGALYWARCPFHEERTPSFAVDPRRGTWRCFGACGEGGDVISFVERFDGLSFLDALRLLAQAAGEEVPERKLRGRSSQGEERQRDEAFGAMEWAWGIYRRLLEGEAGARARTYLNERGLEPETVRTFRLGWAPEGGNPILDEARRRNVPEGLLVRLGLVKQGQGRSYDFFHGRLLIPITDRLGRIAGFGGRVLPGAPEDPNRPTAKYVNTPETPLFHKGRLIYGLHEASAAIRRGHHLILFEGYTDVMAAHQVGIEQACAVLGTSTTEDHAALIRRSGARRVTLVFDGDEAGRKATLRALGGLLPLGVEIDVVHLPQGTDPCDLLVRPGGREDFLGRLESARGWFDFALEDLRGQSGPQLTERVETVFQLLRRIDRPVEQDARIVEMARFLDVSPASVRQQWQQGERRRGPVASSPAPAERPAPSSERADPKLLRAYQSIVGALLVDNSLIPLYRESCADCPGEGLRRIVDTIFDLYENGDEETPVDSGLVMTALGDHPARDQVVMLEELARSAESPMRLASDQVRWMEKRAKEAELRRLKGLLDGAPEEGLLENLYAQLREARVPGKTDSPASYENTGSGIGAQNP